MSVKFLDLKTLVPTQPSVKLRKIIERFSSFNPNYFDPITFCKDGNHNLLVEGHHRTLLLYLVLQSCSIDLQVPAKLERRVKGNPMFQYPNRTFDSIEEIDLEISRELTVPISDIFTRDQDVYAKVNGSSQYLFTLPDLDLLKQVKTKYLMVA